MHYLTANNTKFYKNKYNYKNINNSLYISKNILSLPFHNFLKEKQVVYICKVINKFLLKINMNKKKIYIIAEIGLNHNGNIHTAKQLIRDARSGS